MNWRNLAEDEYFLFARSYHMAARKLVKALDDQTRPFPEFDLCPVLSAYRFVVELHLKVIVLGEGGHFLAAKPDPLSVRKSRSLSWLAQFVCQIVKTLRWEAEFSCAGIADLSEFKALAREANEIDPEYGVFRRPAERARPG